MSPGAPLTDVPVPPNTEIVIHAFHAATLPMLEAMRDRLPERDRATARITTDCFPSAEDLCAIQMTVRPEVINETLILSIVLSTYEGNLELDAAVQDQNNTSDAPQSPQS